MKTIKVNMKDLNHKAKAPVLDYCRKLIKDGEDPNSRLEVYRTHDDPAADKNQPDVICPNIGESAKWTIEENSQNGLRFRKYTPSPFARSTNKESA